MWGIRRRRYACRRGRQDFVGPTCTDPPAGTLITHSKSQQIKVPNMPPLFLIRRRASGYAGRPALTPWQHYTWGHSCVLSRVRLHSPQARSSSLSTPSGSAVDHVSQPRSCPPNSFFLSFQNSLEKNNRRNTGLLPRKAPALATTATAPRAAIRHIMSPLSRPATTASAPRAAIRHIISPLSRPLPPIQER